VFSLEKDLTVSLCPDVEAREKLEADRARGEVITGDTFTRDAISRHDYHTQTCLTTGDAPSQVQGQPAELSAERKEEIQRENAELLHEVDKKDVRIQQLEDELRNLQQPRPAAASSISEGATATPFEVAVSRQERQEEQQDFDSELDVSPRIGVEEEATRRFEELPEPPPRAVTQREHVRQRAQQGVPIPRESCGRDGDTCQDRRFFRENPCMSCHGRPRSWSSHQCCLLSRRDRRLRYYLDLQK